MTFWKPFRHRLEAWGCRALVWGLPRLSRCACVRLANLLGALAFTFDRRGRTVALENLRCVFGSRFSSAEQRRIARVSYQNFARTMLDLFWGRRLTAGNFREVLKVEGFDVIRSRLEQEKRGAIFLCVHEGNWEWASLACGFLGFGNTVVSENFKNPRLTAIFNELRQHSGQRLIAQENSILRLLKIAKRGGATGMLIDLNIPPSQAATVLEAFGPDGLKMSVPVLHAVLAQRAGALLVPVETQPQADGTCRIIAHSPVEVSAEASLQEIVQCCWDGFEPLLRKQPELWLWSYKHFRYRPYGATRPYPDYANESGKFEKLQRSVVVGR